MTFPRRQFLRLAASAAAMPVVSQMAMAQSYPTRPVRIVVTAAPGGAYDILARLIGQWLTERLGQPFVIENRPGGGGNVGTEAVVRAPADGYTLLLCGTINATNAALYDKLNFDFIRDVAPIAGIFRGTYVIAVNPLVPATTVPEFIAYAKRNPLVDPKMKARLLDLGGTPMPMTPTDFGRLIANDTEKWSKVVKFAGIKAD